jgi:small conductance mechanosensitive channel
MDSHNKVLKDPKPTVNIQKMGDGMVTLSIRPFALSGDYWDVYYELHEALKLAFEKNNITAPIPMQIQIAR